MMNSRVTNLKGEGGAELLNVANSALSEGTIAEAITMVTDTTFTTLTVSNWSGADAIGETYPAGLTIYGTFTGVEVATGSCVAYLRRG